MLISDKNSSVLVVDDHTMILNLVGSILDANNIQVYTAKESDEAIQILNKHSVDLILLDIVMPEVDGFQLCKKIKSTDKWKDIPIIFISALNDSVDIIHAFNEGGVDYIIKPFHPEEFIARVKTHLVNKKISDQFLMQLDDLRRTNRYLLGTMHEMAKVMEESRIN